MALDRLVDNTKLNTALTATANAIRAKTGDNSQINFDYTTDTGFASAISDISSGPSSSDAILIVTAPTGSTITATKGNITLTPTMWVQAADNTLDCTMFVISPSLFDSQNAWTVTATRGQDTATVTVTVDSNKQYDVFLSFNVYLVRNGVLQSGYSLYESGNSISQESGYLYTRYTGGGTGSNAGISVLPDISFPYLVLKTSGGKVNQSSNFDQFGVASGKNYANQIVAGKYFGVYNAIEAKTWVVDVSNVVLKDKYFMVLLYGSGAYMNITDVYFAKEEPT